MYGNNAVESQFAYAFGRTEQWLRDFSESQGLPFHELAERVATLLHPTTLRENSGVVDTVSTLRTDSTEGNQATRKVEVVERPHHTEASIKEKLREVKRLRKEGLTLRQIAEQLGISLSSVNRYVYNKVQTKKNPLSYRCVRCDISFKDAKAKRDHFYYTHGYGKKAEQKTMKRATRVVRDLACKACGMMVPNVAMGNHVKYVCTKKPQVNPANKTVLELTPAQKAMEQYNEALRTEPKDDVAMASAGANGGL